MTFIQNVRGFVSTNNSTAAALGADAVFTGTGEDVKDFSSISVSWDADVASADDGMSMQFSTDNSNWDHKMLVHSHTDSLQANHGGSHRFPVLAQYFHLVYTNGATLQAHFRLQTVFHTVNSLQIMSRIEDQADVSADCIYTRQLVPTELDLARRQVTGQRTYFLWGHGEGIGTSWVDLTPNLGDYPWPTTAAVIGVASSDVADDTAGLGARSIEIHGLSATGVDQSEVIIMDGTTEVDSSSTYIRLNRAHLETVGTYGGSHKGDITLRVGSSGAKTGNVLALMEGKEGSVDTSVQYGVGESLIGLYSIPLTKVAYLTGGFVQINTTGTKTADIVLYERDAILDVTTPFCPRRELWSVEEAQGYVTIEFRSHIKIKALTDIWFRVKGSGSNTAITALLNFYLVDANAAGE